MKTHSSENQEVVRSYFGSDRSLCDTWSQPFEVYPSNQNTPIHLPPPQVPYYHPSPMVSIHSANVPLVGSTSKPNEQISCQEHKRCKGTNVAERYKLSYKDVCCLVLSLLIKWPTWMVLNFLSLELIESNGMIWIFFLILEEEKSIFREASLLYG